MQEVSLNIRGQIFTVNKDVLCEHSDYFRAMFSGNYVEDVQQQITIDMLEPNIMDCIIEYLQSGKINLSECPLSTVGSIAMAANYLQITELIKQLEHTLDSQITESNWIEIMAIAKNSSYSKLEQFTVAFGLYSFKSMKPEHIHSFDKLTWYLSHPYLAATSELNVFKFGFKWITQNETVENGLLILLSCLDVTSLSGQNVSEIRKLVGDYEDRYALKVVDCLYELVTKNIEISEDELNKRKPELCEKFTETVWLEICNFVNKSKPRKLEYTPIIRLVVPRYPHDGKELPHYLHTYDEKEGLTQWLEVAENNLWGWSIASWGLTKLVVVCGEYGLGTCHFMRDVKIYDTLKKEWIKHGVELPHRRHGGVLVVDDSLYLVGGVGYFGLTDSAGIYDLKQRTYREIASFPAKTQSPSLCLHDNILYAVGNTSILRYEASSSAGGSWIPVISTELRISNLTSHKNYIYCSQSYKKQLYRFRPDVDKKFESLKKFVHSPCTICTLGNKLLIFTIEIYGESSIFCVEEYEEGSSKVKVKPLLTRKSKLSHRVNDCTKSCELVLSLPPLH